MTRTTTAPAPVAEKKERSAPIFLALSIIAFVLSLGTPKFLLFFPLMGALGSSVVSLFRREKAPFAAVLVLLFTCGLWVLSEIGGGTTTSFDSSPHLVTYYVEGSTNRASLTYSNEQGGTQQEKVSVPWQQSFSMKQGQFMYISAQNQNSTGGITVRIEADGKEIKRSDATGSYTIASASGSCCK